MPINFNNSIAEKSWQYVDVDLLLSNYNNAPYLVDFLDSVIHASRHPKQLIFVDDGSTDHSMDILEEYRWVPFLKIIQFHKNKGLSAALNHGLNYVKAQYVMRADPDDIVGYDKMRIQFEYLEKHPNIDVLGSNGYYFKDEKQQPINNTNFPLAHQEIYKKFYNGQFGVLQGTVMLKSAILKKFLYPDDRPEDYILFSRMLKKGFVFQNLPDVIYGIRVHPKSFVSTMKISHFRIIYSHRDEIFGTKSRFFSVLVQFYHLYFYRKYMLADQILLKYIFLLFSIVCQPQKLIGRIKMRYLDKSFN